MDGEDLPPMDRPLGVAAAAVTLLLTAGFVILTVTGHPTETFVLFVTGPTVTSIIGFALGKKVSAVQAVAEEVKTLTNGVLSGRLDHVDQQLADASEARTWHAARASAAATGQQPPILPTQPRV